MRRYFLLLGFFFVFFLLFVPRAYAQTCYAARSIAQFACVNGERKCSNEQYHCSGDPSQDCPCNVDGLYPEEGQCALFCDFPGWIVSMTCASTGSYLVDCSGPPECQAHPNITTCNAGLEPGTCTTNTEQWTYGCWGQGDSPTPTPGGGGSTPTPTTPCPECGTPPYCYAFGCWDGFECGCSSDDCNGGVGNPPPYCNSACTYGCKFIDCFGGACNDGPVTVCDPPAICGTPPNCWSPYCDPGNTCGCVSTSCTGGVGKPEPYCSGVCTYGCSAISCTGGTCNLPPTTTPSPPPQFCGNGVCDWLETCYSCPSDCGTCPTEVGTVQARAWRITNTDTSCDAVYLSTTPVIPTTLSATGPNALSAQTQTTNEYVSWNNATIGTYTVSSAAPPGYVLQTACWKRDVTAPLSGTGMSAIVNNAETLQWDLGYTLGTQWTQVRGGDVYASATLQSYIPVGATPRSFILNGTGGYPGVATYGGNCNFDSSSAVCGGKTWVSSKNWLVHDTAPDTDFYQLMYRQFGSPAPTASGDTTLTSKLAGSADPYYYDGNLTINAPAWTIPSTDKVVVFVSGNLAINTPINIDSGGFIAFIVNGNITVSPSVGGPAASSAPAVEGIYITSPNGTFITGDSSSPGNRRFVGMGMFIAGSFLLQRDLGDINNLTTSAELFIYNPQLLFTMPDQMKALSVSWQEVAP